MRRLRRPAAILIGVALAVVVLVAAGTLIPRPWQAHRTDPAGEGARTVLLLANPIHTDIALPADPDVRAAFGFLAAGGLDTGLPGVAWIVAGWGGREFYLNTPSWADLRPGPLISGLTIDRSVMHVGLGGPIDTHRPDVRAVRLDEAAFARLLEAVLETFTRGPDGRPILIPGRSYGAYDRFYEAEGRFNAVVGCNVWTARMLRTAGLRTGIWTPLPQLLTLSLDLHNPPEAHNPVARQP